ncbi:MAG: tail fiber domain-containing protein [Verrucomicrobia bacterium]|nr:tail fiber domain-containing protein [Verrucomicrobiota bacterium]
MTFNSTTYEVRYNSSSQRYKTNIRPVTIDSSKVLLLEPRLYDTKDDEAKKDILGYIAEEVAGIDRVFAGYSLSDEGQERPETIDWFKILIYAIEEIKVLNQRISNLENNVT